MSEKQQNEHRAVARDRWAEDKIKEMERATGFILDVGQRYIVKVRLEPIPDEIERKYQGRAAPSKQIVEAVVEEIAPSGNYVKLMIEAIMGSMWFVRDDVKFLEKLPDYEEEGEDTPGPDDL